MNNLETLLIGLDAASERKKFGYAIGRLVDDTIRIDSASCLAAKGGRDGIEAIVDALASRPSQQRALIAIDAPLGWPAPLSDSLVAHKAGDHISVAKNEMFRRLTDQRLRERKHQPLEIGADRIARAAAEALKILSILRQRTSLEIPLAWSPELAGVAAIEVYPAATLRAYGVQSTRYKKPDQLEARRTLANALEKEINGLGKYVEANVDAFDACLCLLCARDFLSGLCEQPQVLTERVKREGWIWVRN